ncbi:SDR family oxidoreductase [Spiroplasma endosymbiont of Danaus chrysippus]|uniref:SDR family oxidoreductase n=1 Tax=Spiroplasma endosymbiont of Danaus chrysippus TaxID=2691041 RepID=UPI00157B4AC6|nr:SDR family oxidoreductase [Spiroplasma endosymbiont of Danaus chrysippus]
MKSKVIVITGASSGIGMETAKLLASVGHKLILAARREKKLKALVTSIKNKNGEANYLVTDVTKHHEVEKLAQFAIKTFNKIDVWINNAGIMILTSLKQKNIKDWDETIDFNIKGTLYGIAASLPLMYQQNSGHIINISSIAGHFAHAGEAVYSATKWAVRAISESLWEEVAKDKTNIRITVISPGAINTELLNRVTDKEFSSEFKEYYKTYSISAGYLLLAT